MSERYKEIVKAKYPNAFCARCVEDGTYDIHLDKTGGIDLFAYGNSPISAWKLAWEILTKHETI